MTPVMCAWPVLPAGAEQMWWHLFLVLICISPVFSQAERLPQSSAAPLLGSVHSRRRPVFPLGCLRVSFYFFELTPRF